MAQLSYARKDGVLVMSQAQISIEYTRNDKQRIARYLMANAENIITEVGARTASIGYKYIQRICKNTVESFYNDFSPNSYGRKEDLKNAFDIGIHDGWQLVIEFGSDLMQFDHHQSNEFVYVNSFIHGYHGGSFGTDKSGETRDDPYWRMPGRLFTSWYPVDDPAPRSTSPYKTINNKIDIYDDNTFRPLQIKELTSILSDIRKKLGV